MMRLSSRPCSLETLRLCFGGWHDIIKTKRPTLHHFTWSWLVKRFTWLNVFRVTHTSHGGRRYTKVSRKLQCELNYKLKGCPVSFTNTFSPVAWKVSYEDAYVAHICFLDNVWARTSYAIRLGIFWEIASSWRRGDDKYVTSLRQPRPNLPWVKPCRRILS